jgi:hypothetical protein
MSPEEFRRLAGARPKFESIGEFVDFAAELLALSQREVHALADASSTPRLSADGVVISSRNALRLLEEMRAKGQTIGLTELREIKLRCSTTGGQPDGPTWAGAVMLLTAVRFPHRQETRPI